MMDSLENKLVIERTEALNRLIQETIKSLGENTPTNTYEIQASYEFVEPSNSDQDDELCPTVRLTKR